MNSYMSLDSPMKILWQQNHENSFLGQGISLAASSNGIALSIQWFFIESVGLIPSTRPIPPHIETPHSQIMSANLTVNHPNISSHQWIMSFLYWTIPLLIMQFLPVQGWAWKLGWYTVRFADMIWKWEASIRWGQFLAMFYQSISIWCNCSAPWTGNIPIQRFFMETVLHAGKNDSVCQVKHNRPYFCTLLTLLWKETGTNIQQSNLRRNLTIFPWSENSDDLSGCHHPYDLGRHIHSRIPAQKAWSGLSPTRNPVHLRLCRGLSIPSVESQLESLFLWVPGKTQSSSSLGPKVRIQTHGNPKNASWEYTGSKPGLYRMNFISVVTMEKPLNSTLTTVNESNTVWRKTMELDSALV